WGRWYSRVVQRRGGPAVGPADRSGFGPGASGGRPEGSGSAPLAAPNPEPIPALDSRSPLRRGSREWRMGRRGVATLDVPGRRVGVACRFSTALRPMSPVVVVTWAVPPMAALVPTVGPMSVPRMALWSGALVENPPGPLSPWYATAEVRSLELLAVAGSCWPL